MKADLQHLYVTWARIIKLLKNFLKHIKFLKAKNHSWAVCRILEIRRFKKYGFLVFNASLLYFQSVRLFLLPGRRQLLVSSLTQVLEALEQIQDEDHMWRAELMTHLVECLFDAGKEPEAAALVKVTSELIASHEGEVYPRLFSIQVQHNLIDENDVMKHKNTKLLVIYNIQKLKCMIEVNEIRDHSDRLKETFRLLTSLNTQSSCPTPDAKSFSPPPNAKSSSPPPDAQSSSPPPDAQSLSSPPDPKSSSPPPDARSSSPPPDAKSSSPPPDAKSSSPPPDAKSSSPPPDAKSSSPPPDPKSSSPSPDTVRSVLDQSSYMSLPDRVELLLELCLVSLRLDQHQVACDCLTELRNTDVTVSQRVMMECMQCEIDLNKTSSRSNVEMRLSVVVQLDALVQAAVRERDARVIQTVCAAQWNTCLPLLQHNLRKKIKKPLLTLTRALENTDSMLLDVLCDVHAVLAAIEEEDDRLEASMKHVKRALQLDHRGLQSHHLSFSSHLLQLRSSLHSSPQRAEDRTAQLIQQAKDVRGRGADRRPLMVRAGITLAPEDFRTVLDADITEDDETQGHLTRLADKAQHHTACVQKVEGHLSGLDKNSDERERVKLWALLVKTAWTYEVYDVCRAACRFCLLYDDGRWKNTTYQNMACGLLSDWIKDLSAYATANFLRGAELGAQLGEAWLVVNAAVHLWNNNRWMLKTRGHGLLLPTYRRLLDLLRHTGHAGEVDLLVLLCDAVAQGLITSAQADLETHESERGVTQLPDDKPKRGRVKASEKSSSTHGPLFDTAVTQDLKKALENTYIHWAKHCGGCDIASQYYGMSNSARWSKFNTCQTAQDVCIHVCEYALLMSNGNTELVSMEVRKQLICTWVTVKRLLKQQIGLKLDMCDQSKNEAVTAMSRVLVGVEMIQCERNSRLMEFIVPAVSVLAQMTQDCQWSDSVVELYVWTQLALSAHQTRDHDLVMTCTHNALQLEQKMNTGALLDMCCVQEMLCTAACVRGQSLIDGVSVDSSRYVEALEMLESSVSVVFKQRALVKARLGESVVFDMKQICVEGDIICSGMWRRVALCAQDKHQRLTCYQNAITTLQDCSSQWQKVEFLLEFGEWLYFTQCPVADARLQIDWAIDILMFTDTQQTPDPVDAGEAVPVTRPLGLRENAVESGALLSDVRRLEGLMRAHTLMALTEERSSPKHQHHLLMAWSFTLHIWKVSIGAAQEVIKDMSRNRSVAGQPVISSRKDKERPDEKKLKQSSLVEEKSGDKAPEISLPISPEQWAQFECPEEIRQAFGCDSGPYTINTTSICMQVSPSPRDTCVKEVREEKEKKRTLFYLDVLVRELESLCLTPLTFAPLHLAEVIAHDLTQSKSQAHVYRLRIIKNCYELGLHSSSPYCEELQSFTHVPEDEQTRSHKSIISQKNKTQAPSDSSVRDETSVDEGDQVFRRRLSICQLCLEKADVCLTINLHESAELLLTRARTLAEELGDQMSLAKSFHLLAVLANQEQRYSDAVDLMKQAQEFDGDENFWYSLIQTLLTAVAERRGRDAHHQVCEITAQACTSFRSVLERRQNRAGVLRFYIASLEIRCAVVRRQLLCADGRVSSRSDSCVDMLTSVCVKLKHAAAELLQLGYRTHAADATLEHANTLRILAVDAASEEEKQRLLLDSFCLMQTAVCLQEDVIADVLNILSPHQEWGRVGQSLGQVILTHLTAVNSLSLDCTETRARTLGMMGKCLRVLAQQRDPLYTSTLWDEPITSSLCCVEMSSVLRAVRSDLSMNVISSAVKRERAGLFQVFNHLTINPKHMRILGEMPPNMKILLLQHSQDGWSDVLEGGEGLSSSLRSSAAPQTPAGFQTADCADALHQHTDKAGECVMILADRMLLDLPLEALEVLQSDAIVSVSRDFSLQVLHARLQSDEAVESDNKKEVKAGRGVKGRDQSKDIKAVPVNRVLPPHTIAVDTQRFKCIPSPQDVFT
ncbi:Cilia- and flagella-associated protein 46 [Triplophysa tibetana]|uniref:Cilia-and flagella-associated protein 46 n=1 Tax=Triplophysa tibetana TaxID=1572043 RepID=A0A5A9P9N9_9TELE|nr:Cilia- and flagella-associated protein 46 [Triplophysa tibetana]